MRAHLVATSCLHMRGTEAPQVRTVWHDDGSLSVLWHGDDILQRIGLVGTPQEVRLALAKGLAAIDRAVAKRVAGPDAILPGEVDAGTEHQEVATDAART